MNSERRTLYGLTGYPLGHSFSKAFFTEKFREEGLRAEYVNFPLARFDRKALAAILEANPALRGLNVTAPHKRAAYELADARTPQAEAAGAANTLRFSLSQQTPDGYFVEAHNTDVEGFREALRPFLRPDVSAALVCGTGGAARAVGVALGELGLDFTFVSRSPESHPGAIAYGDIDASLLEGCPLVVNATPLGTYPDVDSCPPLPYGLMTPANICADLVYNPPETLFMRLARARGATAFNGARMLRLQALASYEFWNKTY